MSKNPKDGETPEPRRYTGKVRARGGRVRLHRPRGKSLLLIPYPKNAPLEFEQMLLNGVLVFGFLKNQQATVVGHLEGDRLYAAMLHDTGVEASDIPLRPQVHDEFAQRIEHIFGTDSEKIVDRLIGAGVMTAAAFYHRVKHFEPEVEAFSAYLGTSKSSIKSFLSSMEGDDSQAALIMVPPMAPVQRGVNVERIAQVTGLAKKTVPESPPPLPEAERTPDLPRTLDLRRQRCVTRIKNQEIFRGTCVAHTAAAMMETELILKSRRVAESQSRPKLNRRLDLSEQYLYWACKEVDGAPEQSGTFIEYAAQVLREGVPSKSLSPGVCKETTWQYNILSIPGNEGQAPVPTRVLVANRYAAAKARKLKSTSPKALKEALADGHPVGLSVFTYHFWTDPFVWREGVISLPFRIGHDGAHAICLVGYRDSDDTHSEGYFVFKNSWGQSWGAARKDPGYGDLPYRYLLTEAIEAWTFEV